MSTKKLQIVTPIVTSVNGQTGDVTLTNESKSLGLTSAAVGQIPKVKAVDSNGVPTEWESTVLSGDMIYALDIVSGEGDTVTINNNFDDVVAAINQGKIIVSDGLYLSTSKTLKSDGTVINIEFTAIVGNGYCESLSWDRGSSTATVTAQLLPVLGQEALSTSGAVYFDNNGGFTIKNAMNLSGIYAIKVQNDVLVNDYTELENAIKDHKVIVIGENTDSLVCLMAVCNEDSIFLFCLGENKFILKNQIAKETKKITQTIYVIPSINGEESPSHSGFIYYDIFTKNFSIKDTTPPIASTSTAGTIKVGNGLSISDDGTLSVTTATYYTGTTDPVNTLGADGDLYLKTGV